MRELTQLLVLGEESARLDVAALQLATIECPGLAVEPYLELLDSHANELAEKTEGVDNGEDFVAVLSDYFFEELGFEGNREDYYAPANSCLNEVLLQRKGIPISLSVVCIEVARRIEFPLYGVALPGHFILRYDDGEYCAFLDPFHRGRMLADEDCFALASHASGLTIPPDESLLDPADNRQIVIRMLNNLRSAYIRKEQPEKLLLVLDLLIKSNPRSPENYRQRGLIRARLQMVHTARQDFEKYLQLAPDSPESAEVSRWLRCL